MRATALNLIYGRARAAAESEVGARVYFISAKKCQAAFVGQEELDESEVRGRALSAVLID